MKSTSQSAIILFLVMIIIVLGSLFWFLYRDYDATRQQAELANSRATRVAAMEQEAGQLRTQTDQIQATRTELENELGTAVFNQDLLQQESVNDQQTIDELETRIAEKPVTQSVPEVNIIHPEQNSSFNLSDLIDLTVAAFDPEGIKSINIIFDNNPSLEIPTNGETSVIVQEQWPISEAGEHKVVVTAVNIHNISSQAATTTIYIENKRTPQQIIDELTHIIGPTNTQATVVPETQLSENVNNLSENITPLILQSFDFTLPQDSNALLDWGVFCQAFPDQTPPTDLQEIVDSPAKELALVQSAIHDWQESQYQYSQLLASAPSDDARAAICALAAGHERWVLEEYIARTPEEQQTLLRENLTPQTGIIDDNALSIQESFAFAYGKSFFDAISNANGITAVSNAWERPPQSTAQILNPNDYLNDIQPQVVQLPEITDFLGEDWELVTTNTLGAFMLGHYLSNFVAQEEVETIISNWRGDQYAIYQQGNEDPMLLALQINWNSEEDAEEFQSIYELYIDGRFSGEASIERSPENSICWSGPSEETICLFTNELQSLVVKAPEYNLAVDSLEEIVEP